MLTSLSRRFNLQHAKRPVVRPDRNVLDQLVQQFRATPYRELLRVVCRFQRGTAILEGEVSSFYLKQIATTLAKRVRGVNRVANRIMVRAGDNNSGRYRRQLPFDWID